MPNGENQRCGSEHVQLGEATSSPLWPQMFSKTGTLSGFCLEWLLDKAEFSNGRKS